MKKIYVLMMALMISAIVGCSNKNDDDPIGTDQKKTSAGATLTEEEVAKLVKTRMTEAAATDGSELPAWLSNVIKEREAEDAKAGIKGMFAVPVYQFSWKGNTFFFVYNAYDSCITCNSVYHQDGTKYEWAGTEDAEDFAKNSKDWKCVYKP